MAMIADIAKASLNIDVLAPEHRDYLRFLWIDDIHSANPNMTLRFATLVFGLTCSTAMLN